MQTIETSTETETAQEIAAGIRITGASLEIVAEACTVISSVFPSLQLGRAGGRDGDVTAEHIEQLLGSRDALALWHATDPDGRQVGGAHGDMVHGAPREIRVGYCMAWAYQQPYQRRYIEVHSASSGTVLRVAEDYSGHVVTLDFGGPSTRRWAECREALAYLGAGAWAAGARYSMHYIDERGDLALWPQAR